MGGVLTMQLTTRYSFGRDDVKKLCSMSSWLERI